MKIIFGYIVISIIGSNFKHIYFNLIFFISLISLIGYSYNLLGFNIPAIYELPRTNDYFDNSAKNIIIFNQKGDGLRNSGMFWEPGAFGCYILLCITFYIGDLKKLLLQNYKKLIIIILALFTTYSTTAYIVFFIIIFITILIEFSKKYALFILPLLFFLSYIAYITFERSEFLNKKIFSQYERAIEIKGEFSPDRFGAFLFDLHYIKKHPIIGNGINSKTRYADHPWLMEEKLGHGNGFSNFIASMGILSMIFYIYHIVKNNLFYNWVFIIILILLLQGEQLLNYPLFLSIPFIFIINEKNCRTSNLPQ